MRFSIYKRQFLKRKYYGEFFINWVVNTDFWE